ncbi:unnamed protein product [Phytomonas sp. EM1]|nr:unnamed protein product [Phytomonas sp. EM1]|eukprot:CCW62466.1 unnamed protein product [Phytomonas sp. isolate EM1]
MEDAVRIAPEIEEFLRAVRAKEVEHCKNLLKQNPSLLNSVEAGGYSALHFAAFNGDAPMIKMLLEHKPEIDLENFDGNAPLVMAVRGQQLESIRLLVNAGADVNKESSSGSTAIHYAASMGYLKCIQLLVELGSKTVFEGNESGSLLHWACHSGNIDCIGTMLYVYNIPVDITDSHGGTPLFTAIFMKQFGSVEFLLEHGANPNIVIPEDGTTPLHIAVEHSSIGYIRLLLDCGANPLAKNKDNETPIDVATRTKKTDLLKDLNKPQISAEKRVEEAARYKNHGNKFFTQGEYVKATKFYTLAIHLDNKNATYFSNRAVSYFNQKAYESAYWDSIRCVQLNPSWPRGYVRKGATELALKKYADVITTANMGLSFDKDNNDLLNMREEASNLLKKA